MQKEEEKMKIEKEKMDEYFDNISFYYKTKNNEKHNLSYEFIEDKNRLSMKINNHLVLEIIKPKYIFLEKEIKILQQQQKIILEKLNNSTYLNSSDYQ